MTFYPSILTKRFGAYLPNKLEIIVTLFIFSAQVLGEMRGFYDRFFCGGYNAICNIRSDSWNGRFSFGLLNEKGDANVNLGTIFVVIVAFGFAITMGFFLEVFGHSADRTFGFNMQKFRLPGQDGLVDTMNDLIVDSIGAIIACIFGWIYIKKEKIHYLIITLIDGLNQKK